MKTFTETAPTTTVTRQNPAMRVQAKIEHDPHHHRLAYRLNCGRDVYVEEIRISLSTLGHFSGSADAIRAEVIKRLPDRAFKQFPGRDGLLVKPVPEGELPAYTFMVSLVCREPVSDPHSDLSTLTVCWLGDDIDSSLSQLIEHEIHAVEWDRCAVDGIF